MSGHITSVCIKKYLADLILLREGVPAEVNVAVAEVAHELSLAGHVLHHEKLEEANSEEHLVRARGACWWVGGGEDG